MGGQTFSANLMAQREGHLGFARPCESLAGMKQGDAGYVCAGWEIGVIIPVEATAPFGIKGLGGFSLDGEGRQAAGGED
jgi:hypothetical protein